MNVSVDITHLLARLTPCEITPIHKIRIGNPRADGGYVMADRFRPGQKVYSLGIGNEISFDLELAERGLDLFQYDHTIEAPPADDPRFHFSKTGIGGTDRPEKSIFTLAHCLAANGHRDDDMILKMDVEGAEWAVLETAPDDLLIRFEQIVMEIHGLERLAEEAYARRFAAAMDKLRTHFELFHVHANNVFPLVTVAGMQVARLMELSFLRKDIGHPSPWRSFVPTELDAPNTPKADHVLSFFPFVPAGLSAEDHAARFAAARDRASFMSSLKKPTIEDGCLIYRIGAGAGLGHVLISILNCAHFARLQRRRLLVDARDFQYFPEDRHRRFHDCFVVEAPPDLSMSSDLDEITRLLSSNDKRTVTNEPGLMSAAGCAERVLEVEGAAIFRAYPLGEKQNPPLYRIGLRGWLAERMAPTTEDFAETPTVGLYFRHGNGEFLIGRFDPVIFPDYEARLAALRVDYAERAIRAADEQGLAPARFFVSSDNADFVAALTAALPNSFSLAQHLPDTDYKVHLKKSQHSDEILFEAVQDVFALSACHALIHSRSLFARFAALNSATLSPDAVHDIGAPELEASLSELSPSDAVTMAQTAYDRNQHAMTALALRKALVRAGRTEETAYLDRRIAWQRGGCEMNPAYKAAYRQAREGNRSAARAQLAQIEQTDGPNPYHLYAEALWWLADGDRDNARDCLRRAVALDDGIAMVNALLAKVEPDVARV